MTDTSPPWVMPPDVVSMLHAALVRVRDQGHDAVRWTVGSQVLGHWPAPELLSLVHGVPVVVSPDAADWQLWHRAGHESPLENSSAVALAVASGLAIQWDETHHWAQLPAPLPYQKQLLASLGVPPHVIGLDLDARPPDLSRIADDLAIYQAAHPELERPPTPPPGSTLASASAQLEAAAFEMQSAFSTTASSLALAMRAMLDHVEIVELLRIALVRAADQVPLDVPTATKPFTAGFHVPVVHGGQRYAVRLQLEITQEDPS